MTNNLTIVLPTYNHPDLIAFCLDKFQFIDRYGFTLEIHDSSDTDDIKNIVESYQNEAYVYIRHPSNMTSDEKAFEALKQVKTKYAFLCGDGFALKEDGANALIDLLARDYDVIELYDKKITIYDNYFKGISKGLETVEYDDALSFFQENCWHTPLYGGSIVKTEIFKQFSADEAVQAMNTGFIYPYTIYTDLVNSNRRKLAAANLDYLEINPYKTASGWLKNKTAFITWMEKFPQAVRLMPEYYDPEKELVIRTMGRRADFLTAKGLLSWRSSDNYNLSLYRKYRQTLREYSQLSKFVLVTIAITPKWTAKIIRKIYRKLKGKP